MKFEYLLLFGAHVVVDLAPKWKLLLAAAYLSLAFEPEDAPWLFEFVRALNLAGSQIVALIC